MTTPLATYPFLHLLLHTGVRTVLETEWLGFAGSNNFRLALEEAVRRARQHHVTGWVADGRRLGAVRPKDLNWNYQQVLVPLAGLGVVKFTRLEAAETLNRLTINDMYQNTLLNLPYEFRHFTSLPEARAWAAS